MKAILVFLFALVAATCAGQDTSKPLPAWKEGQLDIHFIQTGRGNSSFLVFPDGTTLLVDAGDLNVTEFEKSNYPLKVSPAVPDASRRPGEWISSYIRQVFPAGRTPAIDFALITHFHGDHFGVIDEKSPWSKTGKYRLSGITDVAEHLPIGTLIDRGFPAYNYPLDLRTYYRNNLSFTNYLQFISEKVAAGSLKAEALQAGSTAQLRLLRHPEKFPGFSVRNVKSNGSIWTGKGTAVSTAFTPESLIENGKFSENPLSNALLITYGPFRYYTGGDNTGYEGEGFPSRRDVETSMAKAIGQVEAMTLDHHGNRDANNARFMATLSPRVVIAQSWCSDQPGQELAFRLTEKKANGDSIRVFDTFMQPETAVYLGSWIVKAFKSLQGHLLIRVEEGGAEYRVFVLDERKATPLVVREFGPYTVRH